MERVPVFPLPGVVAFPGQVLHFHIFEPRYRKMVRDCLDHGWHLGVALAARVLSKPRQENASANLLQSNLTTYLPHEVIGAGPVRLLKEMDDGRLLIEVNVEYRLRVKRLLQSVPYYLSEGERLEENLTLSPYWHQRYQQILGYVGRLLGSEAPKFRSELPNIDGSVADLQGLVAAFLRWFRIEAATAQRILEEDSFEKRADMLLRVLREVFEDEQPSVQSAAPKGEVIHVDFKSPRSPQPPDT